MRGTPERPRLCVYRSNWGTSTRRSSTTAAGARWSRRVRWTRRRKEIKGGGNIAAAKVIGKMIAERAKAPEIDKVVFDRGGYKYHGRVKALAEAAREAGLKF